MEFTFHAHYGDGRNKFDGLDQYNGAMSLLGLSQILMISLYAFFNREIITQAPSAKGFRVVLGRGKEGSWDQAIHLIITNPDVADTLKDLGKSGLYDLLKWSLLGGLGIVGGFKVKSRNAKKIIRELERENDDLHEKLDEAIKRVHSPVKHQGLTVHVMSGRTNLATFNEATLRYIETELIENEQHKMVLGVSRFNARTGTGRFIATEDAASIPFYPDDKLSGAARRALVDSLAYLTRDKFVPVQAIVSRVTTADGRGRVKRTTGGRLAADVTIFCFGRRLLARFWFRAAYAACWAIESGRRDRLPGISRERGLCGVDRHHQRLDTDDLEHTFEIVS